MAASRVVDRKRVRKEMHNLFHLNKKKKAVRSKPAWRQKFYCLAYHDQENIPLTDVEKEELYLAGLGEQEINFPTLALQTDEFQELLYESFPRLRGGGGTSF